MITKKDSHPVNIETGTLPEQSLKDPLDLIEDEIDETPRPKLVDAATEPICNCGDYHGDHLRHSDDEQPEGLNPITPLTLELNGVTIENPNREKIPHYQERDLIVIKSLSVAPPPVPKPVEAIDLEQMIKTTQIV